MNATETMNEITDRLSPEALAYWNGLVSDEQNNVLILAQREGIDVAVAEVEELAK